MPTAPPRDGDDEIQQAQLAILYLHELGYDMKERLDKFSAQIQEGLLRRLIQGDYPSLADFNQDGAAYGLTFSSPFLFVAAASSTGKFTPAVLQKVEQRLSLTCEAYGVRLFQTGHSVFICGADSSQQKDCLEAFEKASNALAEKDGLEIWFGISTPTSDPSALYSKYVEAVSALEYLGNGEPAVLYSCSAALSGLRYPSEEVETLRRFALEQDEARFRMVCQTLLSYIENAKISPFMRVCVSYDVINTMMKILIRLQGEAAMQKFFSENSLAFLESSGDFNHHTDMIKQLREQICMSFEPKEQKDEVLEKIKSYIVEHCLKPDFSAQCVADEFHMNLPNMSAYFKGKTDITLMQFITEHKMNYAMELLRTTALPLTAISEKTGYSTPSSFIRKFKQYTGMTPGEYKKIHDQETNPQDERSQ